MNDHDWIPIEETPVMQQESGDSLGLGLLFALFIIGGLVMWAIG
jgi:hypothetical protein